MRLTDKTAIPRKGETSLEAASGGHAEEDRRIDAWIRAVRKEWSLTIKSLAEEVRVGPVEPTRHRKHWQEGIRLPEPTQKAMTGRVKRPESAYLRPHVARGPPP